MASGTRVDVGGCAGCFATLCNTGTVNITTGISPKAEADTGSFLGRLFSCCSERRIPLADFITAKALTPYQREIFKHLWQKEEALTLKQQETASRVVDLMFGGRLAVEKWLTQMRIYEEARVLNTGGAAERPADSPPGVARLAAHGAVSVTLGRFDEALRSYADINLCKSAEATPLDRSQVKQVLDQVRTLLFGAKMGDIKDSYLRRLIAQEIARRGLTAVEPEGLSAIRGQLNLSQIMEGELSARDYATILMGGAIPAERAVGIAPPFSAPIRFTAPEGKSSEESELDVALRGGAAADGAASTTPPERPAEPAAPPPPVVRAGGEDPRPAELAPSGGGVPERKPGVEAAASAGVSVVAPTGEAKGPALPPEGPPPAVNPPSAVDWRSKYYSESEEL